MNREFSFTSILGKCHTGGNVLFSKDSESVFSIIGNKATCYNLTGGNIKSTHDGHHINVSIITKPKNDDFLLLSSEDGATTVCSLPNGVALANWRFPARLQGLSFSSDKNTSLIAATGSLLTIYKVSLGLKDLFSSKPHRIFESSQSKYYSCCDWIEARYFAVGTQEGEVHMFKISEKDLEFSFSTPFIVSGLKSQVVGVWFGLDENGKKSPNIIYAVDQRGTLLEWRKGWESVKKTALNIYVYSSDLCLATGQLVCGSAGSFTVYSLEDSTVVKNVEFTKTRLTSVQFSKNGDWVGIGAEDQGQLIVYDLKSETFIMKQQGHSSYSNCISYSGAGEYVASGDNDGKVKVWDAKSGQCFITLDAHLGVVSGLKFSRPPGSRDAALFTSSLDGTCKAFDLLRYKLFRTYTAPTPTAFSCMEIDPSGEIICAAGQDEFDIFLWNVQTTDLLDTLQSHTAPISELAFSSTQPFMVSASWDKTVKIWDIFGSKSGAETLQHSTEVLSVAFNPANGTEICSSTLDGNLTFWDVVEGQQIGFIDGRRDITTGNYLGEVVSSIKTQSRKYFSRVKYTADGAFVICGGMNQYVCLYSVEQRVLLKRFVISTNQSLNGVMNLKTFWTDMEKKTIEAQRIRNKNGSMIGEQRIPGSKLQIIPEIRCYDISFTSSEFAVSTTEGIIVFSNDNQTIFNPFDLDIDIHPEGIEIQLQKQNYTVAVLMAIKISDQEILQNTLNKIPYDSIEIVVRDFPDKYIGNLLAFLSAEIDKNSNLEKILTWTKSLLLYQGKKLKANSGKFQAHLRTILRNIKRTSILDSVRENEYVLEYLSSFKSGIKRKVEDETKDSKSQKGDEN